MIKSSKFVFDGYNAEIEKGKIGFRFSVELSDKTLSFTENLTFPPVASEIPQELLKKIIESLHLILGISYWKLYCPEVIDTGSIILNKDQARFWETVYTKGLGEFFFRNQIDFRGLISFPFQEDLKVNSISFPRGNRYLVPIGGGKDSIVTSELLKEKKEDFDLLIIGESNIQEDVAELIGKSPITIKREIDPKITTLNESEEVYNGHVPVSAIIAFLSLMAGAFYDYKFITVSNEKSANYGNVWYLDQEINHQWSKSEEFERLFQGYSRDFITQDVEYSSFLREMDEFEIMKTFSSHKKYFSAFSSCNRNFAKNSKLQNEGKRWCGKCPKCLFAFILLSSFISKEEILNIFGSNLLNDESLLPVFEELLGIKRTKPFDCVGTPEEVQRAMKIAYDKGEFDKDLLMNFYKREVLRIDSSN